MPVLASGQNQVTGNDDFLEALNDFKNGEARLYCQGGLSPVYERRKEKRFCQKFEVSYNDFGCLVPSDSFKEYNLAVFELLNFKYGENWQKQVRADVIGFKDWKKN